MFFTLHSSVKDLKSVIAEFQGGGKLGPYFTGLHGKHCPLLCTPLELKTGKTYLFQCINYLKLFQLHQQT